MSTVQIGQDFFIKEVKNYSNWKIALWREAFQNSVDAGATKVNVKYDVFDDEVHILFEDNGCGMDKETIENVFFSLGNTTKEYGTIGGFGRARIILCFCQKEYEIYTQNIYVCGKGGEYELETVDNNVNGCIFKIVVVPSMFGSTVNEFLQALTNFLASSQISAKVTVNGNIWNDWLYKRQLTRVLSFGNVYVNKGKSAVKGRLFVRVDGVLMFSRWISADDAQVVVEISTNISRDVLLSNRDSLNYSFQNELDNFVNEIAADTRSALRSNNIVKTVMTGMAKKFRKKKKETKISIYNIEETSGTNGVGKTDRVGLPAYGFASSSGGGEVPILNNSVGSYDTNYIDIKKDYLTEGMIIINKAENSEIKKVSSLYHPDKWDGGKFCRRRKLLAQWNVAVEYALNSYCEWKNTDEIDYRIGFYFSDTDLACNEVQDDKSYALLFNPINSKGKMKFGINDFDSHVEMVTLAAHEVAHIDFQYHDEDFASVMTYLVSKTMSNINKIHKDMKEI